MRNAGYPNKQGLYDPQFEHDNCGTGFLAHMKGKKSHQIIKDALHILRNLEHRGGQGDEVNTGDGAGILLQVPHRFFESACKSDFTLPEAGKYGVGMLFLPQDKKKRGTCISRLNELAEEQSLEVLGWRDVPTNSKMLGNAAKLSMPEIKQVFIKRPDSTVNELEFERKLYVFRKQAEKELTPYVTKEESFYFASLSSRTIVYKGMLTTEQVGQFYLDTEDPLFESAIALVHSRFSTNTFPSWERAHPNRYMIHNGEINTVRGNVNWMHAREAQFETDLFGSSIEDVKPVIDKEGSDSSMFDNTLEFLSLSGRSLAHSAMMMIPEPWQNNTEMNAKKRSFYQYHSTLMEPWDGPTSIVFTDGRQIGACLDRNGLRPSRYYVTKDDYIILSSEVGVVEVEPENVLYKERLHPGQMLLVDTDLGKIIPDSEIKEQIINEQPYEDWIRDEYLQLEDMLESSEAEETNFTKIRPRQQAFGYTYEELSKVILPMAKDAVDPVSSMGYDSPLAVLSKRPQLLYSYFKQLFAQVTNPPIDAIREEIVTAMGTTIGAEGNLLEANAKSARHIHLPMPIINNEELAKLRHNKLDGFKAKVLPILFDANAESGALEKGMQQLFNLADQAITEGHTLLILSDREMNEKQAAIPALLAVAGLHHELMRNGTRTKVSLLLESGEPREVHHHAVLLGYGAEAINPYLVFDSIDEMIQTGSLENISYIEAVNRYIKTGSKAVMKVLSKMGISTIQSYRGAQIFEAVGISAEVVDKYFTWTTSRIGGVTLDLIAEEVLTRHNQAYTSQEGRVDTLEPGDDLQWRRNGEPHQYNPHSIHMLQNACRENKYDLFKKYSTSINEQTEQQTTLRGLFRFKKVDQPIPVHAVEPVEDIVKRFRTGAMSFGSISAEAHETLAIAMNRLGGKSNTGEGGEDPDRFTPDANGDLRRSSIKQVASGRFGVTSHYLVNADEIQIKVAQGAKPGEGGQLPGNKVYPWVAEVRGSTPGVGLISPPPHHDIYSIEDLAELIHDLKNANPNAKVSVKLVAGTGVGTIAAGVAKGRADGIIISGYDGGTGAAARTSLKHTGLPWEMGLAETHQTLVLNNLRDRVTIETDGKLMTGKDVMVAALLGAEEYAFSTAPLVVLGCIVMRVCHLDTCPVGIATQNPELRKKYMGQPEHVETFMRFIAEEMREIMAELGITSLDELIGRTDLLEVREDVQNKKVKQLDLTSLLYQPDPANHLKNFKTKEQDHQLELSLDMRELLEPCLPAIEQGKPVQVKAAVKNVDRVVGTIIGSKVTKAYGKDGLPDDTIQISLNGSAGQSMGAFLPRGMTISLEGDANDYTGKGLSGGKLAIYPPTDSTFVAEKSIIIGNTSFYGATSGEAYIRGVAGERFAVRNSGAKVVVEGVGDHGLEYMTGGVVVNIGSFGRNFAAGMSGGVAYVIDEQNLFHKRCNTEMVLLEEVVEQTDQHELRQLLTEHVRMTGSEKAKHILGNWEESLPSFIKVIPKDYKRMLAAIERVKQDGVPEHEAIMVAFEENKSDKSRVGGK